MKFTKNTPLTIIGAGKISWSFVPALLNSGYKINTVISRNIKDAENLAAAFSIKSYSRKLDSLSLKKNIFVLAVPDNQIKPVADNLSKMKFGFHDSMFIHLSGSQDTSILKSLSNKGAHTASFHIMQTFPSKKTRSIKNSFSAIESASVAARDYLFILAKNLELKPFRLDSRDKIIYHLAGVYASNFINAVLFQSQKFADMLNLKEYSFNDIFAPLFLSTIHNIQKSGPVQALSGPIERGDPDTIKKHIKALKALPDKNPDALLSYLSLSLLLIKTAEEKSGSLNTGQIEIKLILEKALSAIPASNLSSLRLPAAGGKAGIP